MDESARIFPAARLTAVAESTAAILPSVQAVGGGAPDGACILLSEGDGAPRQDGDR